MSELPTGTVTFLFSDIEGSTRLLQQLGERWSEVLAEHHRLLRRSIEEAGGLELSTEGEAFFAVFPSVANGVRAAVAAQRAMAAHPWPAEGTVRMRMGIHTGEGMLGGDNYVGLDVHRAARIAAAAHGGQVLVSEATRGLVEHALPEGVGILDLGEHHLKDLPVPEHVFQLTIAGLPGRFPPLHSLRARPNNLPAQITTFVGREGERAEVERLLGQARLVTLTGPAGTGKTRLALRAAEELLDQFEDGVFFVTLDTITDPSLVASAISQALALRPPAGHSPAESLKESLAGRNLLLVLDNFEQVLEAAGLVAELLATAPGLRVLVTSRAPLHLYGEQELEVPPLTVPDTDRPSTPEALSAYEAVRLFSERARTVKADFQLTAENAPEVAEICSRLEGLPLAIELAAARVKLLSPHAILSRLEDRLALLAGGASDLPPRQRTLRGAIEWSYDLLAEPERILFERLSAFRGFTLEAAEEVGSASPLARADILDLLAGLVDRSLVAFEGERYRLLETLRQFAGEMLLERGEPETTLQRHAVFFTAFAERLVPDLEGAGQIPSLRLLSAEHDNFRVALDHLVGSEDAEGSLRLAGALWRYWFLHRHYKEGRSRLQQAEAVSGQAPPELRAEVLLGAGALAAFDGDRTEAKELTEKAGALYRQVSDSSGLGRAAWVQGAAWLPDDPERGRRLFEESLALAEEAGDVRGEGWARYWLGISARSDGDYHQATQELEHCLERLRKVEDPLGIAWCLEQLGDLASYQERYGRAVQLYEESLAVFQAAGDRDGIARALNGLGTVARLQGAHERAVELHEQALALRRELGVKRSTSVALVPLGWAARYGGDLERSAEAFIESLAISRELDDTHGVVLSLEGLAGLAVDQDRPERAAFLLGAAAVLREKVGVALRPGPRAEQERDLAAVRAALGDEQWEQSFREGRMTSLEEAVRAGLEA